MQSDDTAPRYFEDFAAGETFTTPEVEVTTAEIIGFARLYDPQHFHTDPETAVDSVFGRHVGSGWHTAALTMRLWFDHGPPVAGGLVGLGVDELRWGPLHGGDRIHVVGEVVETIPSRSGAPRGVVRLRLRTLTHRGTEAQHMLSAILVPSRAAAG
jgi:acyl dehydratase